MTQARNRILHKLEQIDDEELQRLRAVLLTEMGFITSSAYRERAAYSFFVEAPNAIKKKQTGTYDYKDQLDAIEQQLHSFPHNLYPTFKADPVDFLRQVFYKRVPRKKMIQLLSGIVLNLSFWYKQTGKTIYAIWVTGTGLLFTVVFNILLVPALGYVGAAVARLLCELSMVVLSYLLNQKYCPVPYDLRSIGGYLLLGVVLYGAGWLCEGLPDWLRYLIYLLLVVIFAGYAVRRERIDLRGLVRSVLHRR